MGYESVELAEESAAGAPPLDADEAPLLDVSEVSPLDVVATGADGGARSEFWTVGMPDSGGMEREHA